MCIYCLIHGRLFASLISTLRFNTININSHDISEQVYGFVRKWGIPKFDGESQLVRIQKTIWEVYPIFRHTLWDLNIWT